jgi:hypothetical protein
MEARRFLKNPVVSKPSLLDKAKRPLKKEVKRV